MVFLFFFFSNASEKERSKCPAQRAIERERKTIRQREKLRDSYIHERERDNTFNKDTKKIGLKNCTKDTETTETGTKSKTEIQRQRERETKCVLVCVCVKETEFHRS